MRLYIVRTAATSAGGCARRACFHERQPRVQPLVALHDADALEPRDSRPADARPAQAHGEPRHCGVRSLSLSPELASYVIQSISDEDQPADDDHLEGAHRAAVVERLPHGDDRRGQQPERHDAADSAADQRQHAEDREEGRRVGEADHAQQLAHVGARVRFRPHPRAEQVGDAGPHHPARHGADGLAHQRPRPSVSPAPIRPPGWRARRSSAPARWPAGRARCLRTQPRRAARRPRAARSTSWA